MPVAIIEKLLDLPFYTEGPAIDESGNFYFTALSGGFIGKIDSRGTYTKWATGMCPNGQVILKNGEHWFCDSLDAGVSRYTSEGDFLGYLIKGICDDNGIQAPNDLILDSVNNLYFTDSVRTEGKVFFQSADGRRRVVAKNIDYANGLALSLDEKYLYVAESYRNRILIIELSEPGVAKNDAQVFAELPWHHSREITCNLPDGLAVDRDGKLWVAHYGMHAIQVLDQSGKLVSTIHTTLPLTSNLCFIEDSDSCQKLLVTGGYGEPGPGAILMITAQL